MNRHLTPDEIERWAASGSEQRRPRRIATHLEGCVACRHEVALFEALERELAALPHLQPSSGFVNHVMARVQLPAPQREGVRARFGQRWTALAAGLAAVSLSLGGMAWWLFGKQELTPGGLLALIVEGARAAAVRVAIVGGRFLYDLGVVEFVASLIDQFALPEAATALALLSLLGCAALWTMKKLVSGGASQLTRVMS